MKFSAQSSYLYNCERRTVVCKVYRALSCLYPHAFFRSLYNRLSRLFAIALLFSFSPIYVCSFLPYRVIALAPEIPPFADGAKPADEYL